MAERKSINRKVLDRRLCEIQSRIWRARCLAQMIAEGINSVGQFEEHFDDPSAAMDGLLEYLDRLHLDADSERLMSAKEVAHG